MKEKCSVETLFRCFFWVHVLLVVFIHFLFKQISRVETRPSIGAQAGNVDAL